jgi:hypothetical protein
MEPDNLLCSRNARPEKALVGRAQWKINQSPSLRENEQAWKDHAESEGRGLRFMTIVRSASVRID